MRFATFVICFYFLFATTTAYAIGPVPLIIGAGGRMLVKGATFGTAVTSTGVILLKAVEWCAKNKKCRDKFGDALELLLDDDNDGKYRSFCVAAVYDNGDYVSLKNYLNSRKRALHGNTEYVGLVTDKSKKEALAMADKRIKQLLPTSGAGYHKWRQQDVLNLEVDFEQVGGSMSYKDTLRKSYFIKCDAPITINNDNKEQIIKQVINNLSDDDTNQIINYYYNDNRIEFEQNIDKLCQQGACDEVSPELEKKIRDGEQDVDKVNKQNCKANEKGVLVSCDKDFELTSPPDKKPKKECKPRKKQPKNPNQLSLELEDDKDTDKDTKDKCEPLDDDKDNDKEKGKDKDEPPIDCNSNKMYKELCKFMDWADDEADEPKQEKVKVKDTEADNTDKDKIDIRHVCPPPENITLSVVGYTTTIVFDYKPYCDFAFKIRPYMVSAGGLMAMYILSGRRT